MKMGRNREKVRFYCQVLDLEKLIFRLQKFEVCKTFYSKIKYFNLNKISYNFVIDF